MMALKERVMRTSNTPIWPFLPFILVCLVAFCFAIKELPDFITISKMAEAGVMPLPSPSDRINTMIWLVVGGLSLVPVVVWWHFRQEGRRSR